MRFVVQPDRTDAIMDAKQMFQRVLVRWASDVLTLRKLGLDRPCARGDAMNLDDGAESPIGSITGVIGMTAVTAQDR
jgi:hypothetical protein